MSISLYLGPYQPFLEEELLQAFRGFRQKGPFAPVTILVPNYLLVGHLRRHLAGKEEKLFNLQIHTLRHYLEGFLEEKMVREGWKNLPDVLVPWVLQEIAKPLLAKSPNFAPVLETPGIFHAIRSTLGEVREGLFTPAVLTAAGKAYQKAVNTKRLGQKAVEFAAVLSAYGDWKRRGKWLDKEDLYEGSLEVAPPKDGPIWIYGFYDASSLQKKVIEHLAAGEQSQWFIPYEDHPTFEYAKPFVEWAKSKGKVEKVEGFKSGKATALGRLQDNLFKTEIATSPNAPIGPAPRSDGSFDTSNVKIFLCPGDPREAKEAVRALFEEAEKRDAFLSDCAVVLRDPLQYRKLLAPAFQGQGIPLSKTIPGPLLESPEAKTLLLLVDCLLKDFPRDLVMNLLSCPNLEPSAFNIRDEEWNPSHWDVLSREARVVEGEKEWQTRILSWRAAKQKGNREEDEEVSVAEELESSQALEKVLASLFKTGSEFEKAKDRSKVLSEWLERTCIRSEARLEVKAVLESFGLLAGLFRLSLKPEDYRSLLASFLEDRSVKSRALDPGGVQVVDLMQARGVPFDIVALPGLVEKSVPRLVRQDPLLLDEERKLLNAKGAGAEISLKQAGVLEERLLFTLALRSAQKAVLLTAPHMNPSTGSPRTPSIYLFESVEAVLGRRVTRLGNAPGLVKVVLVNDWIRKDMTQCADPLERLLTSVHLGRQGDPTAALAVAGGKPFYFEGRDLLRDRQAKRVFTLYEGILQDPEALEALRKDHSLEEKRISASRLETFAACPLRYFYKYVLRLTVTPEPEKVLELQASDRGNLMHDILEQTLRRGLKEGWVQKPDLKEGNKALEEETQKAFRRFEKEGVPGAPALWAWEKGQMAGDLKQVLTEVLQDDEWVPFGFEVGFGNDKTSAHRQDAKTPSEKTDEGKNPEVIFALEKGKNFHLQGRMDRVDVSKDEKSLRVVDYKSGSSNGVSKNSVKAGTKLQLPFYLWALAKLYPEKEARQALYDYITRKGGYKQVPFTPESPDQIHDILSQVLSTVNDGVEKGLFPAVGQACEHCDYGRLCGTGMENRGIRKKEDAKVAAYYRLGDLDDL